MRSNHAMEEDGRRLLGTVPIATILIVSSTRYKINGSHATAFIDTTSRLTRSLWPKRPMGKRTKHHPKEVNVRNNCPKRLTAGIISLGSWDESVGGPQMGTSAP
jgi:hypothetical protein